MFKLFGALMLALIASASTAQAQSVPRQDVPMAFWGTRPTVEVMVNGKGPFVFLIDTGGAGPPVRADASLVKTLGIPLEGKAETSDSGLAAKPIDQVTLASVTLGGWTQRGLAGLTRDYNSSANYLPHIDGILGINFFNDVLLTLDFPGARVRVASGTLPPADGKTILDYELIEGNAYIPVMIGGRAVKAELDTGNIRAVDLPAAWLKTMRMASFPRRAGNSSSVSGTNELREVMLAEPIVIGRYRVERPQITFTDDFAEANIGSSLWRDFVITIDQKNRRVRIVRP
jgi:hypothetical protein